MPTIWPILLIGCAVGSYWNWRAALTFATCVIFVRLTLYFGLNKQQLLFMMLYSVTAFATLFFVDKMAGGFLAIVGLLFCLSLLGVIEPRTKMILSEIAIFAGLFASGLAGPSGGLFTPSGFHSHGRRRADVSCMVRRGGLAAGSQGD